MSLEFEKEVFKLGSELLKESETKDTVFFKKNWWYQKILAWTLQKQSLKSNLFRFIDVLPNLSSDKAFLSHWKEYFKEDELGFISSGLGRLAPSLFVKSLRKQITQVARMFITGSCPEESLKVISKNWEQGLAFSLDILGEEILSEKEAEQYLQTCLSTMDQFKKASWSYQKTLQNDLEGELPHLNFSVKLSALFSQTKVEAWDYSKEAIKKRLRLLFQKAVKEFFFINVDMEYYHHKDLYIEVFKELLMEEEFKTYPHFGLVVQTYLKESLEDLKDLIDFCKKRQQKITIRLVKGAYWDSEFLLSQQKNWPIPVYTDKSATDLNFEKALGLLFKESKHVKIAVGSHNIRSVALALAYHKKYPSAQLEFQFLYGMVEGLAHALKQRAYLTRLYCTMGELIPGMSYLVRRLLENSSNQSFLLNALMKKQSPEKLLAPPKIKKEVPKDSKNKDFSNFPLPDFSKKENRELFENALKKWERVFPVEVPLMVSASKNKTLNVVSRVNPNKKNQIISKSVFVDREQALKTIEDRESFFPTWKKTPASQRVSYLYKTAELLKENFFHFASLQVYEVGKNWETACADVAEAIDFCSFYASSYETLSKPQLTDVVAGEESFLHYEPLGLVSVIAPWNFPLAILTGQLTAPLVCGNIVLIKPAEQSSLTAYELVKVLLKAGFPKESFAFLPGQGEEIGELLVEDPRVSVISFTGSLEVGQKILHKINAPHSVDDSQVEGQVTAPSSFDSSRLVSRQKKFKKAILEMGGKNAIIIDNSADLDLAIKGVNESAFGFQGQKCSACSRVIILEDIYDKLIDRWIPTIESLVIGESQKPENSIGALVDDLAFKRVKEFLEKQKENLIYSKPLKKEFEEQAYVIPPSLYFSSNPQSDLMQKELFAPIVSCYKVKTIEQALELLNQSIFGLTAGLYSRHPGHIEFFKSQADVGNVYINRNCTGALVKRHPFGGRKKSGLGSKAGQKDYLKQFLQAKVVTENHIRRGFSPELFQ